MKKTSQQGEIVFDSEEIGRWTFMAYGVGQPPTKFEEKVITGSLNKDFSSVIVFKNPFKEGITISVTMSTEQPETFVLLLKKTKMVLAPHGTV